MQGRVPGASGGEGGRVVFPFLPSPPFMAARFMPSTASMPSLRASCRGGAAFAGRVISSKRRLAVRCLPRVRAPFDATRKAGPRGWRMGRGCAAGRSDAGARRRMGVRAKAKEEDGEEGKEVREEGEAEEGGEEGVWELDWDSLTDEQAEAIEEVFLQVRSPPPLPSRPVPSTRHSTALSASRARLRLPCRAASFDARPRHLLRGPHEPGTIYLVFLPLVDRRHEKVSYKGPTHHALM